MLTLAGQLKHKATDEQYSKTGLIYLYDIFSGLQHDLCQAKQCVQGLLDINTPADISSQGLHNLPLVGFSADLNMKNKDKCLPVNLLCVLVCGNNWDNTVLTVMVPMKSGLWSLVNIEYSQYSVRAKPRKFSLL